MKVSKVQVKRDFRYAREMMRYIEQNLNTDDYSESGDLGQAINELIACANTAHEYREYMEITQDYARKIGL